MLKVSHIVNFIIWTFAQLHRTFPLIYNIDKKPVRKYKAKPIANVIALTNELTILL